MLTGRPDAIGSGCTANCVRRRSSLGFAFPRRVFAAEDQRDRFAPERLEWGREGAMTELAQLGRLEVAQRRSVVRPPTALEAHRRCAGIDRDPAVVGRIPGPGVFG